MQLSLERAAAALGTSDGPPDLTSATAAHDSLQRAAEQLGARLRELEPRMPRKAAEATRALVEVSTLLEEASRRQQHDRLDALARVQDGLARLRGVGSREQMLVRGTEELCRCGSFDRAILFRVAGSELIAEACHFVGDPDGAAELLQTARAARPALTHMLLETELLRRRQAALVRDAVGDPRTFKPLVEAAATTSYVAAPIMPGGRVIGFLHADCGMSNRPLDELDRDVAWVFAEGFGFAVERTLLMERLQSQRDHVRQLVSSTGAIVDELSDTELELGQADDGLAAVARTAASVFVAPESRIEALLTPREREVLALMAGGGRNAEIADRLVISQATVKSHVKHILRKLRAANRAEAVSRYLRMTGGAHGG